MRLNVLHILVDSARPDVVGPVHGGRVYGGRGLWWEGLYDFPPLGEGVGRIVGRGFSLMRREGTLEET